MNGSHSRAYQLLNEVKLYLERNYKPDGYNVGWNCGHVGGQHVFHSHLHIIPRYANEKMAEKRYQVFI
ncbi:HIT family protein [Paenibacillus sp. MBLB4367]|uniref:HIT family protein n=1 Tax=Paenibacillus sp. MBLB4367 TaxID=3384767 RepID=UPI0039081EE9